jgi:hypothetical protein
VGDAAEEAGGTCSSSSSSSSSAATSAPTKVMPRVIVELAPRQLVARLLSRPGPAVDAIVAEVAARGYDGVVLEAWAGWASLTSNGGSGGGGAMDDPGFRGAALGFVRLLSASLIVAGGKVLWGDVGGFALGVAVCCFVFFFCVAVLHALGHL